MRKRWITGQKQAAQKNETNSTAGGQPPDLSPVGYFETPANANQAAGELQSVQQRNERRSQWDEFRFGST